MFYIQSTVYIWIFTLTLFFMFAYVLVRLVITTKVDFRKFEEFLNSGAVLYLSLFNRHTCSTVYLINYLMSQSHMGLVNGLIHPFT